MAYLCTQLDIILASVVAGIWLGPQNLNDHVTMTTRYEDITGDVIWRNRDCFGYLGVAQGH